MGKLPTLEDFRVYYGWNYLGYVYHMQEKVPLLCNAQDAPSATVWYSNMNSDPEKWLRSDEIREILAFRPDSSGLGDWIALVLYRDTMMPVVLRGNAHHMGFDRMVGHAFRLTVPGDIFRVVQEDVVYEMGYTKSHLYSATRNAVVVSVGPTTVEYTSE